MKDIILQAFVYLFFFKAAPNILASIVKTLIEMERTENEEFSSQWVITLKKVFSYLLLLITFTVKAYRTLIFVIDPFKGLSFSIPRSSK